MITLAVFALRWMYKEIWPQDDTAPPEEVNVERLGCIFNKWLPPVRFVFFGLRVSRAWGPWSEFGC